MGELEARLFRHPDRNEPPARVQVDFGWVHRELARPGVCLGPKVARSLLRFEETHEPIIRRPEVDPEATCFP